MKKITISIFCLMLSFAMVFNISEPTLAKESIVSNNNNYITIDHSDIINPISIQIIKMRVYYTAKKNGTKAKNHSTQVGGSLGKTGRPYSSKDLVDKNGNLKQRRYYNQKGNADMDIDYRHGGNGKEPFPHRHDWNNGSRGKAYW